MQARPDDSLKPQPLRGPGPDHGFAKRMSSAAGSTAGQRMHTLTRVASALGLLFVATWIVAMSYSLLENHTGTSALVAFITVPFVLWLANACIPAVFRGRFPLSPWWPFASFRVLLVYMALVPIALRVAFG